MSVTPPHAAGPPDSPGTSRRRSRANPAEPEIQAGRFLDALIVHALFNRLTGTREFSGSMDGEGRDLNAACGYPNTPTLSTYRDYYDREGLATKAVDVYPNESWAASPEVYEDENPAVLTPFERDWNDLVRDHSLWFYCHLADKMSGIGRFGILLLGLDDPTPLDQPPAGFDQDLNRNPGRPAARKLAYLQAYPEDLVQVTATDRNPSSPRFGQPVLYTVTLADPSDPSGEGGGGAPLTVHWSRVVHLVDKRGSSKVYGVPRMQNVLNRLYDLRKILGGAAEMYWRGAFPGFAFKTDPTVAATARLDVDSVREEFESYANGMKRYLALRGMEVQQLAPQVADPSAHFATQVQALCAALEVPVRIFLGSEAGHLASTQDQETWAGRVRHRRTNYLDPMVVRPLVQRLIRLGCVSSPAEGETAFKTFWPDPSALTAGTKADVGLKLTQALLQYVSSKAELVMPYRMFLTLVLQFTDAEAAAVVAEAERQQLLGDDGFLTARLWQPDSGQDPRSGTTTNPTAPTGGSAGFRNAVSLGA